MTFTTPVDRAGEHKRWHQFERGGCLTCGYYCTGCPVGVATCKCRTVQQATPKTFSGKHHLCNKWCRVHVDANYGDHQRYPIQVVARLTTFAEAANTPPEKRYLRIKVWIGPGAFFPYRPDYKQRQDMLRDCPHVQLDLTCNTCLRHTFRPLEI